MVCLQSGDDLMQAGKLRHVVYIQARSLSRNEYGEQSRQWSDEHGPLWGAIEPTTGRELSEAEQVVGEVTHRIRLRYSAEYELTSAKRFRSGERIFEIVSVFDRDERNRELVAVCKERPDVS
jgi:SPP1 family predicted phage head-tail adaptor